MESINQDCSKSKDFKIIAFQPRLHTVIDYSNAYAMHRAEDLVHAEIGIAPRQTN